MSLRFQRRVSLFPGLRLNFSRSGVSATIGVPGAGITLGGRQGPMMNLGVPGTGLSFRAPIGGGREKRKPQPLSGRMRAPPPPPEVRPLAAIASASVDQLTSPAFEPMRDLLLQARTARLETEVLVDQAAASLRGAEAALLSTMRGLEADRRSSARLERSWLRPLRRGRARRLIEDIAFAESKLPQLEADIASAREELAEAEGEREAARIDAGFAMPGPVQVAWNQLAAAFDALSRSASIWDVTAARDKRAGEERSDATSIVERKRTQLSSAVLPSLDAEFTAQRWHNVNGHDLYLYPGFLIVFLDAQRFAVLGLDDLSLRFTRVNFQETEALPSDAERIGTTWRYANKGGGPDRRYAQNPEIPVMGYGELYWSSPTGLAEAFQFSNRAAAEAFCVAYDEFCRAARMG